MKLDVNKEDNNTTEESKLESKSDATKESKEYEFYTTNNKTK